MRHPPADAPADEGLRRYTIDLDAQDPRRSPWRRRAATPAVALPPVADSDAARPQSERTPGEAAPRQHRAPAAADPTAPRRRTILRRPQPAPRDAAPPRAAAPRTAPPRRGARGSFAVQLGSFGSRENADRLVRDMTAKGFAAFVAPITSNGRELYRVRVGPTRDRACGRGPGRTAAAHRASRAASCRFRDIADGLAWLLRRAGRRVQCRACFEGVAARLIE